MSIFMEGIVPAALLAALISLVTYRLWRDGGLLLAVIFLAACGLMIFSFRELALS